MVVDCCQSLLGLVGEGCKSGLGVLICLSCRTLSGLTLFGVYVNIIRILVEVCIEITVA